MRVSAFKYNLNVPIILLHLFIFNHFYYLKKFKSPSVMWSTYCREYSHIPWFNLHVVNKPFSVRYMVQEDEKKICYWINSCSKITPVSHLAALVHFESPDGWSKQRFYDGIGSTFNGRLLAKANHFFFGSPLGLPSISNASPCVLN